MVRQFEVHAKAWKSYSGSEAPVIEQSGTVRVKGLMTLAEAQAKAISGFDKWMRIRHRKYRTAVNATLHADLISEEAE